ncbi:MAG: FmdB family zinc ribbon protein [Planctomycetota bacterium]|jgi:DNA-directed RNA polymerase subunit RPC12/RpoP
MQLRCGQCGSTFEAEVEATPEEIACPHCGHVVSRTSTEASETPGFAEVAKKDLAKKFHVMCGSCDRHLTVSRRWAGRRGRCPACRGVIQIPHLEEYEDIDPSYISAAVQAEVDRLDLAGAYEMVEAEEIQEIEDLEGSGVFRPRSVKVVIAAMVAVTAVVCIGILIFAGRSGRRGRQGGAPARPADKPPADVTKDEGRGEAGRPVSPTAEAQVEHIVEPAPRPPVEPTSFRILSASSGVFAAAGYRPAGPGRVYVKVTAEVTAAKEAVKFLSHGDDVALEIAGTSVPSLGLARASDELGELAVRRLVSVPAGKSETLTFVFEVLDEGADAALKIRGLKGESLLRLEPLETIEAAALAGTYVERPPRNLRPLLRDPVMAAVQSAASHALHVKGEGADMSVSIPAAGVTGSLKPLAECLYEVRLVRGAEAIRCKLRFIDAGKRAILYLADEPFHQITYERK